MKLRLKQGLEAADVERLVMCDFYKTNDIEFKKFIEQLPDKCWVKYDLSAVRLGWEAHKIMGQAGERKSDVE